MIVVILERPAARPHTRALLGPVALDIEHLARLEPIERCFGAGLIDLAARFHHRMRGERGIPHRGDAGLAISLLLADHEEVLDRLARDRARRMILGIAEQVEHHHAVRHRRVDRAEPVLAVEPFDHPIFAGLDRAFAQLRRPQPVDRLEHAIERIEPLGPQPFGIGGARLEMCGLAGVQFVDPDVLRISSDRPTRGEHQQRHHHGARPIAHLGEMDREPARQQDDLGRHRRHRRPRPGIEQRELDPGKDIARRRAARGKDRGARAGHMRRVHVVADHLERIISLHACAEIETAGVEQPPAVVRGRLDTAQIARDLRLQHGIDRLAEIVAQKDIFGRDRAIGFELEHPMPVGALRIGERGGGAVDRGVDGGKRVVGGWGSERGHARLLSSVGGLGKRYACHRHAGLTRHSEPQRVSVITLDTGSSPA